MDNAQSDSGYRYPSIEMKKSPNNKAWWAIGLLALFTPIIFFFLKSS